jgi:hypothetical protein
VVATDTAHISESADCAVWVSLTTVAARESIRVTGVNSGARGIKIEAIDPGIIDVAYDVVAAASCVSGSAGDDDGGRCCFSHRRGC